MQIPLDVYTGFTNANHLEELTLQLGRRILSIQKNPDYNSGIQDIISIVSDEETETIEITCEGWEASLVNGIFKIKNYFSVYDFPTGSGSYPFNRAELCDAFFHCASYQQLMELNLTKNPGDGNQFISISINNTDTKGRSLNYEMLITDTMKHLL